MVSGLADNFIKLHNNLSKQHTCCHTFERQLSKCCLITIVVSISGEIVLFDHVANRSVQVPEDEQWKDKQAATNAVADHRTRPPVDCG